LKDDVKFCDGCGNPVAAKQKETANLSQGVAAQSGVQDNKVIFMLAYLGILFFLPLISCPDSKEGRFHANQGLLLLITAVAGRIIMGIFSLLLPWRLWMIVTLLLTVWGLGMLALAIIGMINAYKNEQKPLPVIGKISIIK